MEVGGGWVVWILKLSTLTGRAGGQLVVPWERTGVVEGCGVDALAFELIHTQAMGAWTWVDAWFDFAVDIGEAGLLS